MGWRQTILGFVSSAKHAYSDRWERKGEYEDMKARHP